jgi:hypothetical protein
VDYRFDEASYTRLDAAGIAWEPALYVLTQARPRMTRHIGSVLQVVGAAPDGRWLAVALIEEADNVYRVVGARWLDPDEAEFISKMVERGSR